MEYQYKVINFEASVTTADVRNRKAAAKVCAQLEIMLQEYARDGWELQGQYEFSVDVKAGCFDAILGLLGKSSDAGVFKIYQLVFKKPM